MNEVDCMIEPWPFVPRGRAALTWTNSSDIASDGGIRKSRMNDADVRARGIEMRAKGLSYKNIARDLQVDSRRLTRLLKGVL